MYIKREAKRETKNAIRREKKASEERGELLLRFSRLVENIRLGTRGELLNSVISSIGKGGAVYTPNPIIIMNALFSYELYSALMSGILIPDGVGLLPLLNMRSEECAVYPGVELGEDVLAHSEARYAIIGGVATRAERALRALSEKYPSSRGVLALDGYSYSPIQIRAALDITSPEVVFVCLGSPRQELLISSLRSYFPRMLFFGLGGAVDIYSGALSRAPAFFRSMHLEWLWRMLREPRRFKSLPTLLSFDKMRRLYKNQIKSGKIVKKGLNF